MLKLVHTHENGKMCFTSNSNRETRGGRYRIKGEVFYAMWNGYCAMWRVYDVNTGYEIASFRQEFYEQFIEPFKISDLELDVKNECVR